MCLGTHVQQVSGSPQCASCSSALIPCQHQLALHGIEVFCLVTRNKYHEKYHVQKFLQKVSFFHKSVNTERLIRTLFQEDIQVDDVSQICV